MEGEFSDAKIQEYNKLGYNIYYLPNYPSEYEPGVTVDGSQIDTFEWVFVDMDLKSGNYFDKDTFIVKLSDLNLPPTKIVDSGNGIHVYWRVIDLDALSFLKLSRRLMRVLNTDDAVSKIYQLMRCPGTINTKDKDNLKPCTPWYVDDLTYTCEQIDAKLAPISIEDETYCRQHLDKTYRLDAANLEVSEKLPLKFGQLLKSSKEVRDLWVGTDVSDRSRADFRIGHLLFANGFTKEEALSVLVNTRKSITRAPIHRISYARGIVEKIWTFELDEEDNDLALSKTVKEIISKGESVLKGTRLPCWRYIDATAHGFRLGQVIGLVAGVGVGKTAVALNMFLGFVKNNPDYVHFFIPLEQPENEIADRWRTMCNGDERLYEKVHILSNYGDNGEFRHLSFSDIRDYLLKFQRVTGKKIGCVVIDHIGVLKKKGQQGENQDLMTICHEMKGFAVETNTLLIMQSQSNREKAGEGDLELNKDAAYGTIFFEAYCDYLITVWQPLKRMYSNPDCPTITSFKFCKIRHKKRGLDDIKEGVCYNLYFDPRTEHLKEMTQSNQTALDYFLPQAINRRKADRKTDIIPYESITWTNQKN